MASAAPWKATALGLAVVACGVVGTTFAFAEGRDAAVTVAPIGVDRPVAAEPAPSRPWEITPQPVPAPEPVPAPAAGDDDLDDDLDDDPDDTDN